MPPGQAARAEMVVRRVPLTSSSIPANNPAIGRRPPKSWSTAAWAVVAAFSVVLSYVMTIFLGLACLLFGWMLLLAMLRSGLSFFGVVLDVFTLMVGGTVFWSLIPRRPEFQPNGPRIDLARETRLRAEIEAVAQALQQRAPDEVYLITAANAAVMQRGRRRIMLLGLPLLQLLSISQFRAILAHEFGHYYAGDTRLGPWVFGARMKMAQVLIQLSRDSLMWAFLSRLAIVAILRLILLGGLGLWWRVFNSITQFVSRKQEFRCDELACYLAGSENLEQGLCSIHRAAAAFPPYWKQVVTPVLAGGFRPGLADGFGRFVQTPAIAVAAAQLVKNKLASNAADPMDSHPGLGARVRRAQELAIPAADKDDRPAAALFEDLPGLELRLLHKLLPQLKAVELKTMEWDTAAAEVYEPLWRRVCKVGWACFEPVYGVDCPGSGWKARGDWRTDSGSAGQFADARAAHGARGGGDRLRFDAGAGGSRLATACGAGTVLFRACGRRYVEHGGGNQRTTQRRPDSGGVAGVL